MRKFFLLFVVLLTGCGVTPQQNAVTAKNYADQLAADPQVLDAIAAKQAQADADARAHQIATETAQAFANSLHTSATQPSATADNIAAGGALLSQILTGLGGPVGIAGELGGAASLVFAEWMRRQKNKSDSANQSTADGLQAAINASAITVHPAAAAIVDSQQNDPALPNGHPITNRIVDMMTTAATKT